MDEGFAWREFSVRARARARPGPWPGPSMHGARACMVQELALQALAWARACFANSCMVQELALQEPALQKLAYLNIFNISPAPGAGIAIECTK